MEVLHREIAFGVTIKQVLIGVLIGVIILWAIRFLTRPTVENKIISKRCNSCGWKGPAARDNRQCPKCKAPLFVA